MLLVCIYIYPVPENVGAVIDLLSSMRAPVAALPDAMECRILSESQADTAVLYLERWQTRKGLHNHLRSPLFARVLEAMELSEIPPSVELCELQRLGGLECVEAARHPTTRLADTVHKQMCY